MRFPILLLLAAALLAVGGCTQADLGRAQQYADATHLALDQATSHVDALQAQLAIAQKALAESGDARVAAVVEQLSGAVTVAKASLPAIRQAAADADTALAGLKAQAAEGVVPWWKVAIGIAVPVLLPLAKVIPGVGPLVGQIGEIAWSAYTTHEQKAAQADTEARAAALTQTVAGIEAAKAKLAPDAVATLHAALGDAQDAAVKETVAIAKIAA